jgi:hypothetical protein
LGGWLGALRGCFWSCPVYGMGDAMNPTGTLVLSFCDGAVVIHLKTNKLVTVTKKGSIIIKDKKPTKVKNEQD